MDRTEAVLLKLFAALPCPAYDIGILGQHSMYRLEALPPLRILRMLPYLKSRNATGAHVYGRPTGESAYTLLDDADSRSIERMAAEGFAPAAVVETSPGNFQAWLRHRQHLKKGLGTLAAKMLAERFGTDRNAADWRRFGRLPGFKNCKPQHLKLNGSYPSVLLVQHVGGLFAAADSFYSTLSARQKKLEAERAELRINAAKETKWNKGMFSVHSFRAAPRYAGRPAAADMAFSVAAYASGWPEREIADALEREYFSRNPNSPRRPAYISRTLKKSHPVDSLNTALAY